MPRTGSNKLKLHPKILHPVDWREVARDHVHISRGDPQVSSAEDSHSRTVAASLAACILPSCLPDAKIDLCSKFTQGELVSSKAKHIIREENYQGTQCRRTTRRTQLGIKTTTVSPVVASENQNLFALSDTRPVRDTAEEETYLHQRFPTCLTVGQFHQLVLFVDSSGVSPVANIEFVLWFGYLDAAGKQMFSWCCKCYLIYTSNVRELDWWKIPMRILRWESGRRRIVITDLWRFPQVTAPMGLVRIFTVRDLLWRPLCCFWTFRCRVQFS